MDCPEMGEMRSNMGSGPSVEQSRHDRATLNNVGPSLPVDRCTSSTRATIHPSESSDHRGTSADRDRRGCTLRSHDPPTTAHSGSFNTASSMEAKSNRNGPLLICCSDATTSRFGGSLNSSQPTPTSRRRGRSARHRPRSKVACSVRARSARSSPTSRRRSACPTWAAPYSDAVI